MILHTISFHREQSFDENIAKMERLIKDNSIPGEMNFFLLGEMVFDQYEMTESNINDAKFSQASHQMEKLKDIAKENKIFLSMGYVESDDEGNYNSQLVIDPSGNLIHNHRKHNLTKKERQVFLPGTSPVTSFEASGLKFAVSICYDLFSPEIQTALDRTSDVFLHSLCDPQNGRFTLGFSGRFTGAIYLAANRFDDDPRNYYNGHIGIYSKRGKKIGFSMDREQTLSYQYVKNRPIRCMVLNYSKIILHLLFHLKETYHYLTWNSKNKK